MKNQINQLFIALFFIYGSLLTSCKPEGDKGGPEEVLHFRNQTGFDLNIVPYWKDSTLNEISIKSQSSATIEKKYHSLGENHCASCVFFSLNPKGKDSIVVNINNKRLVYTFAKSATSKSIMSDAGYNTKQSGDYEYTHEYFFTQEHVDSAK